MVAVFASAGWIVAILAFLSCGRTQPVVWCWWTFQANRKPVSGCVMSLQPKAGLICLCYCFVKRRLVSQRPNHPFTNRRKTGGKAEPFSKRFWKILGATRFVRLFLLYGQIGPDRKNMAIMQDLTSPLWKIAKMQDRIKWPNWPFGFGQRQNDRHETDKRDSAQRRHVKKVRASVWRSKLYCCWHHPSHSTVIHHKRAAAMLY